MGFWEELEKYIVNCIANGLKIIPVKGVAQNLAHAKRPLIPRGLKYTEYSSERQRQLIEAVTLKTLDLVRSRRITAFGVPGSFNRLIIIDIDSKKFPVDQYDKLWRELARRGAYVEKTASGGIHIAVKARNDDQLRCSVRGKVGEIDLKTFGYIIAHPSALYVLKQRKLYRYTKLPESPPIYGNIAYLDEVIDLLNEIAEITIGGTNQPSISPEELERKRNVVTIPLGKHVPKHPISILTMLEVIMNILGCHGYRTVLGSLKEGIWPVPYVEYGELVPESRHSRSSWGIVEYNIGAVMRILSFDPEHVEVLGSYIDDIQSNTCIEVGGAKICGDPAGTPASETMMQGYKYVNWGIDLRERCVLKMLGICPKKDCNHNVVTLLLSNLDRVVAELLRMAITR